ncbi:methionine adenosyltransferase [Methanoculleus receptaculi]|jgi:S-adenosylmethionine synthetase|uniref:Methionine adenosyltransferase n=1 Tax=Methanoculleus receptaculi TaxID=394967 RepID=A0AAX4FXE8_9EURY|nr:methionine adenosyltransferase [Methanoculleus receptaculi]WOX58542.1 methionine adenosyltransferase [Methanoculleus receptaculi]
MIRNISVEGLEQIPIEKQRIELVERKCLGHPDSLADGIAESISRALSRSYLEECGSVLHHNTDQGEVVAGESLPKFGGGIITRPIYFLISGRATKTFNGVNIPADAIAIEAARDYIKKTLPMLNMERDVIVDCRMGRGSTDLQDVFWSCSGKAPRANDTSFGVGHAPFSEAESIVLGISEFVDRTLRPKHPVIGQDCKIMCLRDGDTINLTLAMAFVDRYCSGIADYIEEKNFLTDQIASVAGKFTSRRVNVAINTADDLDSGSIFLTVSGTSAEMGDDGSVGRGNRANGLITPNRPMSMEATSGKNPINHIGKIYNLLATEIAKDCVARVDGIEEIYVRLLSQIGHPIDQPHIASAQILPKPGFEVSALRPEVEGVVDTWLEKTATITEKVIRGELSTF